MIWFVRGKLFTIKENSAIIDCNGIGYEIICTLSDISKLSEKKGEDVFVFTHLIHKEDSMKLYGFLSESTKKGFLGLLRVSGIGPKAAINILSHYSVNAIYDCVEKEDIDSLKRIPGIGPKMAKKIIFDLKGVLPSHIEHESTGVEKDLISAMVNLGYKENDVIVSLKKVKPLDDNFEKSFKQLLKELAGK